MCCQAAHVGIGVSGVEGLQAACASDFAIAQVLFLYGLNYSRIVWTNYCPRNQNTEYALVKDYIRAC